MASLPRYVLHQGKRKRVLGMVDKDRFHILNADDSRQVAHRDQLVFPKPKKPKNPLGAQTGAMPPPAPSPKQPRPVQGELFKAMPRLSRKIHQAGMDVRDAGENHVKQLGNTYATFRDVPNARYKKDGTVTARHARRGKGSSILGTSILAAGKTGPTEIGVALAAQRAGKKVGAAGWKLGQAPTRQERLSAKGGAKHGAHDWRFGNDKPKSKPVRREYPITSETTKPGWNDRYDDGMTFLKSTSRREDAATATVGYSGLTAGGIIRELGLKSALKEHQKVDPNAKRGFPPSMKLLPNKKIPKGALRRGRIGWAAGTGLIGLSATPAAVGTVNAFQRKTPVEASKALALKPFLEEGLRGSVDSTREKTRSLKEGAPLGAQALQGGITVGTGALGAVAANLEIDRRNKKPGRKLPKIGAVRRGALTTLATGVAGAASLPMSRAAIDARYPDFKATPTGVRRKKAVVVKPSAKATIVDPRQGPIRAQIVPNDERFGKADYKPSLEGWKQRGAVLGAGATPLVGPIAGAKLAGSYAPPGQRKQHERRQFLGGPVAGAAGGVAGAYGLAAYAKPGTKAYERTQAASEFGSRVKSKATSYLPQGSGAAKERLLKQPGVQAARDVGRKVSGTRAAQWATKPLTRNRVAAGVGAYVGSKVVGAVGANIAISRNQYDQRKYQRSQLAKSDLATGQTRREKHKLANTKRTNAALSVAGGAAGLGGLALLGASKIKRVNARFPGLGGKATTLSIVGGGIGGANALIHAGVQRKEAKAIDPYKKQLVLKRDRSDKIGRERLARTLVSNDPEEIKALREGRPWAGTPKEDDTAVFTRKLKRAGAKSKGKGSRGKYQNVVKAAPRRTPFLHPKARPFDPTLAAARQGKNKRWAEGGQQGWSGAVRSGVSAAAGPSAPANVKRALSGNDYGETVSRLGRALRRQDKEFSAAVHPISGRVLALNRGNHGSTSMQGLTRAVAHGSTKGFARLADTAKNPQVRERAARNLQGENKNIVGPKPVLIHNHPKLDNTPHGRRGYQSGGDRDLAQQMEPGWRHAVISHKPGQRGTKQTQLTTMTRYDDRQRGKISPEMRVRAQSETNRQYDVHDMATQSTRIRRKLRIPDDPNFPRQRRAALKETKGWANGRLLTHDENVRNLTGNRSVARMSGLHTKSEMFKSAGNDHKKLLREYGDRGPLPKGLDRDTRMKAYEARYAAHGGHKGERWQRRADVAEGTRNAGLVGATVGGAAWLASRGKRTGPLMARKINPKVKYHADTAAVGSATIGGAAEIYGEYARNKRASYASSPGGVAASALTRMRANTPEAKR